MDIFALTRALVNLDSTTGREQEVGNFLAAELSSMATHWNGRVERMQAAPGRENVFASFGEPVVRFQPTWTPCRLISRRRKTRSSFTDVARATPRGLSRR